MAAILKELNLVGKDITVDGVVIRCGEESAYVMYFTKDQGWRESRHKVDFRSIRHMLNTGAYNVVRLTKMDGRPPVVHECVTCGALFYGVRCQVCKAPPCGR